MLRKVCKYVLIPLAVLALAYAAMLQIGEPSNNREWNIDQAVLPSAEIKGNIVTVYNIRNFVYASTTSYTPRYYDKKFDLRQLMRVWYVVEPFSGVPGSAHTFLSFEFEGNQFLAISVEIRKEKGERFSALKGFFNRYELMYVIADERDVITLRSNYRKDLVYLYPGKTTQEKARELLVSMLERANTLKEKPEFYNTLFNTCTTNIVRHINSVTPGRVSFFSLQVFFPKNSDRLAYTLGLIDTELPFEQARERYLINARAEKYANDPNFSIKIRGVD